METNCNKWGLGGICRGGVRKSNEWGFWGNDEKQVFQIVTRPQNEKK